MIKKTAIVRYSKKRLFQKAEAVSFFIYVASENKILPSSEGRKKFKSRLEAFLKPFFILRLSLSFLFISHTHTKLQIYVDIT